MRRSVNSFFAWVDQQLADPDRDIVAAVAAAQDGDDPRAQLLVAERLGHVFFVFGFPSGRDHRRGTRNPAAFPSWLVCRVALGRRSCRSYAPSFWSRRKRKETMGWIIKAALGESIRTAQKESERVEAAAAAQGMPVRRLTPTAFEVGNGSRKITEEIIDSPVNWEHGAVYMEADDPVQHHLPAA